MPFPSKRFRDHIRPGLLVVLSLALLPAFALAGSICGNLTDVDTGLPVAGAGVFVRHPDGLYADALAVSDGSGDWCVHGLVAGTYTLEIRVDDYVTAYVNGVVVSGTVSDVPLTLARTPLALDPPWPNPASGGVKMRLHVARPAPVEVGIYDARGRLVRNWTAASVDAGSREYFWDGHDRSGRPAPAGLYLVRVRSGDVGIMRPIILTR